MRIAAVIPVWNRPKLILDALQNVASQRRPPDRLVVVDDGSRDETPDVVERWLRDHSLPFEATLLRTEHANLPTARNRGAAAAPDVDVYSFLDCDDLWPEDHLERVERTLLEHPDAVVASSDFLVVDYRSNEKTLIQTSELARRGLEHVIQRGTALMSCSSFSASAFHRIQGFDGTQTWGEDLEISLRAAAAGPWVHVPGRPVTIRHCIADKIGEEPSLTHLTRRPQFEEACMFSRFLFKQGGEHLLEDRVWRDLLAEKWFMGGQQCVRLGDVAQGAACFADAYRLRPRTKYRRAWPRTAARRFLRRRRAISPRVPFRMRDWSRVWRREFDLRMSKRRYRWSARWMLPYGDAKLPKATVILLSYRRPKNMDRMVRVCLAARFVDRVILSNNNPKVRIADWVRTRDERLTLIDQTVRRRPSERFQLASESEGEHFLCIDDDVFLRPSQINRLYEGYLSDTSVPHGFEGQCWVEENGSTRELYGMRGDRVVDAINRAYLFSREHVELMFARLPRLGIDSIRDLGFADDLLLSYSAGPPRIHEIGPVLECATSFEKGVACCTDASFLPYRAELRERLLALAVADAVKRPAS